MSADEMRIPGRFRETYEYYRGYFKGYFMALVDMGIISMSKYNMIIGRIETKLRDLILDLIEDVKR